MVAGKNCRAVTCSICKLAVVSEDPLGDATPLEGHEADGRVVREAVLKCQERLYRNLVDLAGRLQVTPA